MPDDRRINRRNFFRNGFRELLKPVAEQLEEKLVELSKIAPQLAPEPDVPPAFALPLLRPPGALAEADFLATCSRCGTCVNVCPADAIAINDRAAGGAPYVNADVAACVLCAELACMNACPSGALVPVPLPDIDMGTARWVQHTCLRVRGEPCTICVDACPVGEVAIRVDANLITVLDDGCTGCGLCQQRCPTSPKSIVVEPAANRR